MKDKKSKSLPAAEVSLFCQQAAMILKAGIPLYDGMEVLYRNYKETPYAGAFQKIYEGVRDGGTLYEGVKAAGFFPKYMVHMVHVGETSGELDQVLESLGDYYERESRMQASIRSAIVYPLILVVLMTVVMAVLVIRVLPIFTEVFLSLGTGLAGTEAAVLSGGLAAGRIVLAAAAVLLTFVLLLFLIWSAGGKQILLRASQILPPVRRLLDNQTAQRFAEVIAMVLASGYHLEHALELIPDLLPDKRNIRKAKKCLAYMEQNGDFAAAVEQASIFHPLHEKMIRVGVESGQTDRVMERIAGIYEIEVDEGIHRLVSWIEPALVAVLTLIIGGILLSVMLPLVSIMMSIS
ncbi:MAG: type II secretion system F family protein [Lachnospiraceae bacterium]|jgi:type IV pilus assembly protein PilC|nr:type II secretion system F family protein [Lachnospiraceae bacterium]